MVIYGDTQIVPGLTLPTVIEEVTIMNNKRVRYFLLCIIIRFPHWLSVCFLLKTSRHLLLYNRFLYICIEEGTRINDLFKM
jgi:hypothetical protein